MNDNYFVDKSYSSNVVFPGEKPLFTVKARYGAWKTERLVWCDSDFLEFEELHREISATRSLLPR